ncbi:hypothetical protein GQ44DRAFT_625931 [Phaeosphaeriaceae sp. PMI808]|nr:hypothetical protein GQ44DRAFT_625931 [Phaeosphaeriaceae sp. PMI808]
MSLTREPCEPPATPTRPAIPNRQILFRHPGYDASNNVLLKLFAPDIGQDSAARGLYAQYALYACGIVAGNRWDGWLSEVKDPDAPSRINPTTILQKTSYYFHLPPLVSGDDTGDPNLPYPIVPTFREWRFPHDRLPELWKQTASADCDFVNPEQSFATSNLTLALQARDVSCRITGCREGTQVAHICPQKEVEWWYENGMSRYNFGSANTLDDISNALLLRTDLHIAFDKPKFVFVPKPSADPEKPKLVTHLVEASAELEYLYHNRALHSLRSSVETLFARFAWSIFPLLDTFLTCRARRRLLLANNNATFFDREGFVSWERCAQFSRKRSQSPKKRKPEAGPAMGDNIGVSVTADGLHPRKRYQCQYAMSPQNSPTLNNLAHQSPHPPSASFSGAHNSPDVSTLAHTWLEQERLRSDTRDEWGEKKAWAKSVWAGNVTLDEGRARKWLEICGVEFQDAES